MKFINILCCILFCQFGPPRTSFASQKSVPTQEKLEVILINARSFLSNLGAFAFDNFYIPASPVTEYLENNCEASKSSQVGGDFHESSSQIRGESCGIEYVTHGKGKFTVPTNQNWSEDYNWNYSKDPTAPFGFDFFSEVGSSKGSVKHGHLDETWQARFQFRHNSTGIYQVNEIEVTTYCDENGHSILKHEAQQVIDVPNANGHITVKLECDWHCSNKCLNPSISFNGQPISSWKAWMIAR